MHLWSHATKLPIPCLNRIFPKRHPRLIFRFPNCNQYSVLMLGVGLRPTDPKKSEFAKRCCCFRRRSSSRRHRHRCRCFYRRRRRGVGICCCHSSHSSCIKEPPPPPPTFTAAHHPSPPHSSPLPSPSPQMLRLTLSLLCSASLLISVSSQASPVVNNYGSPAQLFIDAAQRIAGDGSAKVLKDAAQYAQPPACRTAKL
jgi:hypothetical protein